MEDTATAAAGGGVEMPAELESKGGARRERVVFSPQSHRKHRDAQRRNNGLKNLNMLIELNELNEIQGGVRWEMTTKMGGPREDAANGKIGENAHKKDINGTPKVRGGDKKRDLR
jgi:hypothetical protein